ncbi:acyl-CoA/acyl-ACP dehydrogenase [Eggerthellaceae bacterium zg-1084]|uniref:Acyl-CoA/acyl-ACP dehydrogenase n=1 Tax=Berryella wangjianweii TaxID=2734634 RepID=A0A6M8J8E7_9ACTN|nr:acyl-CoA dehydrogenase family protein [Berryella wangjianweii]NPD30466.1 acyl-CoA/acyl-ACP dehydrogenase [Berryella wangjianweii]NPD32769.1 acyl-CoA/acyl-ACP dehydrogenase [Eggerthellaceae bacterium zg-997]QKF07132.1 acyl-CoA/acyl-ACP dehydrogenase [Berryella wangjianweii]
MTTFYDKAKAFAEEHITPLAADIDRQAAFPAALFDKIVEAGYTKLLIPQQDGGLGLTLNEHQETCMAFAESCPTVGLSYMMHNVALHTVLERAGDELRSFVIDEVVNHGKVMALAYSEFGTGTHFYISDTTAEKVEGGVRLNGMKSMVTMAGYANYYLVLSHTSDGSEGITNWVVPADAEGVAFKQADWHGLGMRGNASCPIALDNVVVPERLRIGAEGEGVSQVFEQVALPFILGLAAVYTGAAEQQCAIAVEHAKSRVYPNGQSLAQIETVQLHLSDLYIKAQNARALTVEAARSLMAGEPDCLAKVLAARINASENAIEASRIAMRVVGGKGYNGATATERLLRDSFASQIMAPSVDVLHVWLGKALAGLPLL